MAITSGITTAAKLLLLQSLVNDHCKLALYTNAADIGPDTKFYTSNGEVRGKGYKAGGFSLKGAKVWDDRGSACITWDSFTIPVSTISANGFMVYDASANNTALFVGAYSQTFTSTEGPFTVNIPSGLIYLD